LAGGALRGYGLPVEPELATQLADALAAAVLEPRATEVDEAEQTGKRFAKVVGGILHAFNAAHPGQQADRLVVLLDDLDRCSPDAVVALLDAIKLIMCADGEAPVVFVFALDRHIVGEAIRKKYSGSSLYSGENYLEKIFDLSLEVPRIAIAPDQMSIGNLIATWISRADVSPTTLAWLTERRDIVASVLGQPCFANPRVMRRTVNRLALFVGAVALEGDGLLEELARVERFRFLVAWVAGCERYRAFRDLFFTLSDAEFGVLHGAALGSISEPTGGAIADLLRNPGFRLYYAQLLGLGGLTVDQVISLRREDSLRTAAISVCSPRWSDGQLRRFGL
jgi:hypothetical protein